MKPSTSRVDLLHQDAVLRRYRARRLFGRQHGAFAIMTVALILVILGFFGLAIELSRMYNRKVELQTAADMIALSAAVKLNGTADGVTSARAAAEQAAGNIQYAYNASTVEWSDAAISFGARPDGDTWLDAQSAALPANAGNLYFVRVDTSRLDPEHGSVVTSLLRMFPSIPESVLVSSKATAGRTSVNIMPLAICAMSETMAVARDTELVEYGFRRGISYDLMKLNPTSDTGGANYLVNPLSLGGNDEAVMNRLDVVRPFVCTGTLAVPTQAGGRLKVERNFPLGSLYEQLNSRFNVYAEPCVAASAPPDSNIKQYPYLTAFPWMDSPPTGQSAESRARNGKLQTVADLAPADIPATTTGGMYGPLWVYARPVVKDNRYVEGAPEPTGGYTRFNASSWSTLYAPGGQRVKTGSTYTPTPYTAQVEAPAGVSGMADRRVLNVPLLRCSVPTDSSAGAEVLGIGRFFMTVRATSTELHAEFAGLAHHSMLGGEVKLFP